MITFTHIYTGIIAREIGVDKTSWLVIESNHLKQDQKYLNVLTIPAFIVSSASWIKNEIKNTELDDSIISKTVKEIIENNSLIFQEHPSLYFLV